MEKKNVVSYPEGMYVVKKGRPNAPVAKVIEQDEERLLIEYLNGEQFETYGTNLEGEARYVAPSLPPIENIIFNAPYTIVIWADGVKTKAKSTIGDEYNREFGLMLCYIKYMFGNTSPFRRAIAQFDKKVAEKEAAQAAKEEAKAKAKADAEKAVAEKKAKKAAESQQAEMNDLLIKYILKNLQEEGAEQEVEELPVY